MNRLESLKLSALKELAYGASHEINNPLANIAARAQSLLRDEKAPERRYALEAIHRQAMRAHEMISDLMLFARPPALTTEVTDLCAIVEDVLEELAEPFHQRAIRLLWKRPDTSIGCQGTYNCMGDPGQLTIAIGAVCANALEAIGREGEVTISLSRQSAGYGPKTEPEAPTNTDWLVLTITDDGPGISERVRSHLFDPFFSGREAGRGLGFGLSKCWRIVTQHGGSIQASNRPQTCPAEIKPKEVIPAEINSPEINPATSGALFTIYLPAIVDPNPTDSTKE